MNTIKSNKKCSEGIEEHTLELINKSKILSQGSKRAKDRQTERKLSP